MAGARLRSGSATSSDGSEGGAPLYAWSPENRGSRLEEHANSSPNNSSPATSETGNSISNRPAAGFGFSGNKDPRTPSDQAIRTPEPNKPQRSVSKSNLRTAAKAPLAMATTSAAVAPPTLTLSAYPGPGAVSQHQSNHSAAMAPRASLPGSTTHSFISAMQAMSLNAADDNLHPAQKIHRDQTGDLQTRIWGLRQGMYHQPSVPKDFLIAFDYDVQELMHNTVKMNEAVDKLAAELKKAIGEQERIRGLEATVRDLERDLAEYKERAQSAERTLASLASRTEEDMRAIQFLKEQLRQNEMARTILQEQVNGKRNLWLNVHSDPQERAAVLDRLRSSTPFGGQTLVLANDQGYGQSVKGSGSVRSSSSHSTSLQMAIDRLGDATPANVNPPNVYNGGNPYQVGPLVAQPGGYSPFQSIPHSHSGPAAFLAQSQHRRRLSTATTASTGYGGPSSRPSSGPRRTPREPTITETGSPKERKRNAAGSLMRADLEDTECLTWADEFQSLFALIYGFCASYFHELPTIDQDWKDHIRREANGELWEYICRICQSNQEPERGDNAMRLLKDRDSRPYLMQRVVLQHIMVFIFSSQGWKDYSEDVDEEMEKLEEDLKGIDPSKTYERQVIIDRRAQLVGEMTEGSNAAPFKNFKLTQHHQYLKTMVAPFLSRRKNSNVTNEAFYDLFAITTSAWELSAKLFRSRLTFQYVWNDAGARFSVETHEPLDCSVDRRTLQSEYCRVRLCATPVVTMRNDQGMTINTKNILKAGVLVMRY